MQTPYTLNPHDAFVVAQSATGLTLGALLLHRPLSNRLATAIFAVAIALATALPDGIDFVRSMGAEPSANATTTALTVVGALATAAAVLARPWWIAIVAAVGEACLYRGVRIITDSSWELDALHLAWLGLLLGLYALAAERASFVLAPVLPSERRIVRGDVAWAIVATLAALLTTALVIHFHCDSADEWSYTWQAAVFAKGRAYAQAPPCSTAMQSFWVFSSMGRAFSQYTPGWPYFMAPFTWIHAPWLAGPVSLGLLVAGLRRVTRRAAHAAFGGRQDVLAPAANAASLAIILSHTCLMNGGSRFPHVFICACFAWAIEAACALGSPPLPRQEAIGWGVVLGLATSWACASRPLDGGVLGIGVFLYFVYAVGAGRLEWRAVLAVCVSFTLLAGLTLVILRLQLGKWFVTGYSLTETFYPWNKFNIAAPKANELRWAVPLATGSYCWWPLAPATGLAGLAASLRGDGRRISFMLVLGVAPLLVAYSFFDFGRGIDFGYGPRYELPCIVAMAVGTGVILAPLWVAAVARARTGQGLRMGGPAAIVAVAWILGVVRIAPLVWPFNLADIRLRNVVFDQAQKMHLKNAVVWIAAHTVYSDLLDVTQNLPLELYPKQDVVFVSDRGPESHACVEKVLPGRARYHAVPGGEGVLLVRD